MDVRLIFNHITHHARFSGYDQLAKYVAGSPFISGGLPGRVAARISWKWLEKIKAYHTNWYGGPALRRELEICQRMLLPTKTLYHFFYAENDLRVTSVWKVRWNNKIVGSYHQPPEYLDGHIQDKRYIRGISAAVVVAASQIPYLSRFLPPERIHHVPHGVDVHYWHPDPEAKRWEAPTFLLVGQWLRDIDMVVAAIRALGEDNSPCHFRIVTFPEHAGQFAGLKNTEVLTGIPDEGLLDEYRRAHALFLPLKMSTANNAVLEAMSCGTGVITTRTGGVPEYVDSECALLLEPGDAGAAIEALRSVASDPGLVRRLGGAARKRAEAFSWEVVGEKMNQVYRRILGKS